jgi:hypothetical protein
MAQQPGFLKDLGVAGSPLNAPAFNLLDQIIGAQGRTRGSSVASKFAARGRGFGGKLAAQEAGIAEQRRISDMGLVEDVLVRPALEARNLQLNKLREEINKLGGQAQIRGRLFQGMSQIANQVGQAFQLMGQRQQPTATGPTAVPGTTQSLPDGTQV